MKLRDLLSIGIVLTSATRAAGAQSSPDKPLPMTITRRFAIGGANDASYTPSLLFRGFVAVDGRGRLYAIDNAASQIAVFDSKGKRIGTLGRKVDNCVIDAT